MSTKDSITVVAEKMAIPVASGMGYEIVDIEYKKEGKRWYLRFFIDKPGGVTIDDCKKFSEAIGRELDNKDPIPSSYILEVSSPGIDRPLNRDIDFERNINKKVNVKLFETIQGLKRFDAVLHAYDKDNLELIVKQKGIIIVPREKVAVIKPVIEF